MDQHHPFPNGQISWNPYDYSVPQQDAFFDQQGGQAAPSQFDNYYNMGYPQLFPDPNVPIMPQQNYNQFDNFMGADNQMAFPFENGPMFDPSGACDIPLYDIHDGLQQFNQFQPASQDMNYPQFPQQNSFEFQPNIDDFSWCYETNDMYNYNQNFYTMEDFVGGPVRTPHHTHDRTSYQPYNIPSQPASTSNDNYSYGMPSYQQTYQQVEDAADNVFQNAYVYGIPSASNQTQQPNQMENVHTNVPYDTYSYEMLHSIGTSNQIQPPSQQVENVGSYVPYGSYGFDMQFHTTTSNQLQSQYHQVEEVGLNAYHDPCGYEMPLHMDPSNHLQLPNQQAEIVQEMSTLLAEAGDITGAIGRGDIRFEEPCYQPYLQIQPKQQYSGMGQQNVDSNIPTVDNCSGVNTGDGTFKDHEEITVEKLLEAEPSEADALMKGLEHRIEAICNSDGVSGKEEDEVQTSMRKVIESKEFADLLELVEASSTIEPHAGQSVQAHNDSNPINSANASHNSVVNSVAPVTSASKSASSVKTTAKSVRKLPIDTSEFVKPAPPKEETKSNKDAPRPKRKVDLRFLDFIPDDNDRPKRKPVSVEPCYSTYPMQPIIIVATPVDGSVPRGHVQPSTVTRGYHSPRPIATGTAAAGRMTTTKPAAARFMHRITPATTSVPRETTAATGTGTTKLVPRGRADVSSVPRGTSPASSVPSSATSPVPTGTVCEQTEQAVKQKDAPVHGCVLRAEELGEVFVELRAPGNDVIVDPATLDALPSKGRKRSHDDCEEQPAKRPKVTAGTWFDESDSTNNLISKRSRRRGHRSEHTGGKWFPSVSR